MLLVKLDDRITTRLEELVLVGRLAARQLDGLNDSNRDRDRGDEETEEVALLRDLTRWGISCINLLERVFGPSSNYYTTFKESYDMGLLNPNRSRYPLNHALGTLQAAQDDYHHGFLFEVRNLITADVFDDFLSQAQHLLDAGYPAPAAVVAGSVLEDGLRKLCQRRNIALPEKPKLDVMNADLAKVGAYNKLTQKRITALADIRNNAAHGQWDQFKDQDVADMVSGIHSFMAEYFT